MLNFAVAIGVSAVTPAPSQEVRADPRAVLKRYASRRRRRQPAASRLAAAASPVQPGTGSTVAGCETFSK